MLGEPFLAYCIGDIKSFLGDKPIKALFIPYARVIGTYDALEELVKERFNAVGHDIESIHRFKNQQEAVEKAEAIVVSGGNTFQLVNLLHKNKLIEPIQKRVAQGIPYIGWSAGANVACPTLMTTNDMPIVQPESFSALNLINFQINPHYTDLTIIGHGGETREARIMEYIELNHDKYVIGLPEGTMLRIEEQSIQFIGVHTATIFKKGISSFPMDKDGDWSFLSPFI